MPESTLVERFIRFLGERFGSKTLAEPGATDVLRQPVFPGLDSKPQELPTDPMMAADPGLMEAMFNSPSPPDIGREEIVDEGF